MEFRPEEYASEIDFIAAVLSATTQKDAPLRRKNYYEAISEKERLAPHAYGEYPSALLDAVRPGEPDNIKAYRKSVFEAETASEWVKAQNVILRIFTPGQYSIQFPDDIPAGILKGEDMGTYCRDNFGEYGSVLNYLKDAALPATLADPEGVQVVVSWHESDNGYKMPVAQYYSSENCLYLSREIFVILTEEKSLVKTWNSEKAEGLVLLILTKEATYKAEQYGKKSDMTFNLIELERHELGYIPARVNGGVVCSKNGKTWSRSFLSGVVPHWNKALIRISEFDGFQIRHLSPQLIRAAIPCSSCHATGMIKEGTDSRKCSDCGGTGYGSKKSGSPYQDITVDIKDIKEGMNPSQMATYIAPPSEAFEQFRKQIQYHIERGFASVNMEIVNRVGDVQSGVAKAIDRQDLNGFLSDCSEHFFDMLEWLYWVVGELRYGAAFPEWQEMMPTVERPVKFDYVTLDSLLYEMKQANEADANQAILQKLNLNLAAKTFGDDSVEAQEIRAAINLDPYSGLSSDDIISFNALGVIDKTSLYIHANMDSLLARAMNENADFLALSFEDQQNILRGYAIEKMGGEPTSTSNKLRETVGGIAGLVEISRQVASGIISREAAEQILIDLYNFDPIKANEIVKGFNEGSIQQGDGKTIQRGFNQLNQQGNT